MHTGNFIHPDELQSIPNQKLLVSHLVQLQQSGEQIEIRRGMPIIAQDGLEVGVVAAVVFNCPSQKVTHILLGHLPPTAVYRLIPLLLIDKIDGSLIMLKIQHNDCLHLPIRRPD